MKVALYEDALDQVALRYARRLKTNQVAITAAELAALVEKNWPKIVAEALSIYHRTLKNRVQPGVDLFKPAA